MSVIVSCRYSAHQDLNHTVETPPRTFIQMRRNGSTIRVCKSLTDQECDTQTEESCCCDGS